MIRRRDKRESQPRDRWPEHPAALDRNGHCRLHTLPDLGGVGAREEGLHGEVVGPKDGGVDDLVDDDFGGQREQFGGVIKVFGYVEEPAV